MALELGLDQIGAQVAKLAKLPRLYRHAVCVALAAVVGGLYVYLLYMPAREELAAVRKQERELQRQVSEVQAMIANFSVFEEELETLQRRFKHALRQLPDSKELPVLLTDITSLGKDSGLEMKAFRPRTEVPRDFYAEVPIEIEFDGRYHDIASFFDRVAKLPRIVNVGRLEMTIAGQGIEDTRLRVSGEATTFRFLDREPAAAAPTAGVAKANGGRS